MVITLHDFGGKVKWQYRVSRYINFACFSCFIDTVCGILEFSVEQICMSLFYICIFAEIS